MSKTNSIIALTLAAITFSASSLAVDEDNYPQASKTLANADVSTSEMLERIEDKYADTIYGYELEEINNRFFHEVKMVDQNASKVTTLLIDAKTGQWIERVHPINTLSEMTEKQSMLQAMETAKVDMREAVAAISLSDTMVVSEVDFEQDNGVSYFEVETVGPTGDTEWSVNIENRRVTAS
ncbi:hypothetical protein R50073_47630 [Maricurvus nonylphenolicus]|uniref:PepSY domain-containing protein n=1 Tax=Maricurvus nonylphenolicus TaxID=1008307 RepID=UPI0036F2DB5E